jgi:serine/threonine protein kinase
MEDLSGKQLGPYRIVEPLGEGGMAAVYKAYQATMDRYVAVKVLPRFLASDPEFVGRFKQEAKVLARLQHPHILPVYDFGEHEGYTYLVMQCIEAGTLADLLQGRPLPGEQIQRIVAQVGDALDYAHSQGIVHRDVKPSNVLIDERGNCQLTDFGIAKIVEGATYLTRTGGTVGTPAYMSPEQIRGEKLDGRSDIYSLGIVLYEMATGRQPFRAETPPAVFVKHLHDPLPPPRKLNQDLPEVFERVILKALSKDREHRFRTASEMVAALVPVTPVGLTTMRAKAPRRRRPVLMWALISLVVVALIAVAGFTLAGGLGRFGSTPTAAVTAVPLTHTPVPSDTPAPTASPSVTPSMERPTPTPSATLTPSTTPRPDTPTPIHSPSAETPSPELTVSPRATSTSTYGGGVLLPPGLDGESPTEAISLAAHLISVAATTLSLIALGAGGLAAAVQRGRTLMRRPGPRGGCDPIATGLSE